ncbi:GmrSD restriction endonuclease domain-containing protein [Bifidobacterium gallicum]|uniref:DUF262 domain-containing protein n=1 Tax=Bifidobacterium gallicum DSM 20093 = LMG 11596 TaxID=561180 RepID=D1NV86_9BIFI|nr:DUF262 domain-containing protein [Bifidobacterium gallicum]EFA22737.1 hypothetical protein BIFGAL_03770 [Bifidobacterium gallicum DSM 20093 = LMG 11596]KFI59682.1 hypothetical protein BGLCM_0351 [Bifidobacterium gallicum DSM 20093 = LMG 11596]
MTHGNERMIDELVADSIFSGSEITKYVIPIYQRAYAWGETEIGQLIDDIWEHEDDTYYIGSLIVHKRGDEYEVIDGQQRLTTLLLLSIVLRQKPNRNLSFDCRKKANNTLDKYIDGREIPNEELEKGLAEGIGIIKNKFKINEKGVQDKNAEIQKSEFLRKLSTVKLFRIQVPEQTDLNRYFEIMNTRGEQLEQHDILKARLMNGIHNVSKREWFAKIWNACSDMTGYVQMHFGTNARNHIFSNGWDQLKTDYEYENNQDQAEEPKLTIGDILSPGFKAKVADVGIETSGRVRFESIISFPYFLLHVLRVFVNTHRITLGSGEELPDQLDDKKLLTEFKHVGEQITQESQVDMDMEEFASQFAQCLLTCRFLFDKYIIKREFANESTDGEWSLKQLEAHGEKGKRSAFYTNTKLRKSRERNTTAEYRHKESIMLQSCLRVSYTSAKTMHWITELLEWLYENIDDLADGTESWDQYPVRIEQIAQKAVVPFLENRNFEMGVSTPHIVFNYLDYLLWKENPKKYDDFAFEFRNSVEHWYPQHPSEGTFDSWTKVDCFGNLCILARNANSKFSNLAPDSKKNTYRDIIKKGSLKLRIMAEKTIDGPNSNADWKDHAESYGLEMIKKLIEACGLPKTGFPRNSQSDAPVECFPDA